MGAGSQARHADVFVLEIGDATDAAASKQLETPEVLAGKDRDRFASVDCNDVG